MKTHFHNLATVSRITALICAGIAGIGAAIGFSDMTANLPLSVLLGGGVAIVLAFGWHTLLSAAEHSRRTLTRVGLVTAGVLLVCVALATSGWSLATAIGGRTALSQAQATALADHAAALDAAKARVDAQEALINTVKQSAVATQMLGAEEGTSGEGPLFRSYQRTSENLDILATSMTDDLGKAAAAVQAGTEALTAGRAALGNDDAFSRAMADAEAATAALLAIDISRRVLSVGMVGLNDAKQPQLEPITAALYKAAAGSVPAAVEVPVYAPMTRAQATFERAGSVLPAWIAAIGVDVTPLILLCLLLLLSHEPLLREVSAPKVRVSDDELRVREDNVVGLGRKAGE